MPLFTAVKRILPKRQRIRKIYYSTTARIKRRPIVSFLVVLLIFFLAILLGSLLSPHQKTPPAVLQPKPVQIYKIGSAPRITVQAKIEKSGLVKMTSLAAGVIAQVNIKEGDFVVKGQNLIAMATNYQGENALLVQAEIAQRQYQNVLNTYKAQKDVIDKQKELANKTEENAEDLRAISAQSIGETQDTINLDQDIINTLNHNLDNYNSTNSGGLNDALILQTKEMKSQFQGALNGLNQALRATKYQSSNDNPPADIASLQRKITLKQLEIQEKALALNREITRLQAFLAQINADIMHPVAPFSGMVERVYVKEGQAVTPGAPLLLLSGSQGTIKAVALVSQGIAQKVSRLELSTLHADNFSFDEYPFFISTEATDNQLFSIQYVIPDDLAAKVADAQFIAVDIPVGYPDTGAAIPFVPLDAVYQSETQAYLFVVKNGKAVAKTVTLGQVYGGFVEIISGLEPADQVILNRNVIDGDLVKASY